MSAVTASSRGAVTSQWWRPVGRYFTRWVVGPIATVLLAAFLIFVTLSLSPGDPVAQILGSKATDEQRVLLREKLGLDQPVLVQFFNWLTGALQGDFGASFTYRESVLTIMGPRLGTTLTLVVMSIVIILIIGLGLGILGGVFTRIRSFVTTVIGLMISIPNFVLASLLIGTFAVALGLFPTFGAGTPGLNRIWHLTMPAIALSVSWGAYIAQLSIASISEETRREHVTTAFGRGLPFGKVLRKHILRNAGIPVLTASGLMVAALVAGSLVVETAFGVDGIGGLLVRSVMSKDQPVVTAISVMIVLIFVVMTTVIDILQVALDPQLREKKGAK